MTLDDLLKLLAGVAALLVPVAAIVASFVTLGRRPKPAEPGAPARPAALVVGDTSAVQGTTLQLAEGWQEMAEDLRDQLTAEREHGAAARRASREELMRVTAERDVALAERDLARGVLHAHQMPVPTLVHPSHHREDPDG